MLIYGLILFILLFVVAATSQENDKKISPIVEKVFIHSEIKYTYAKTLMYSEILNPANNSQEVIFKIILPEEAFITSLFMTYKGTTYQAYIEEKEEAMMEYIPGVNLQEGAELLEQEEIRYARCFKLALNVEPRSNVSFKFTYEELLTRKNKSYDNEIHINPRQVVKNMTVIVDIEDQLNITNVQEIWYSKNENYNQGENIAVDKTEVAPNKVRVTWTPTQEVQRQINKDGLNGKMIVKYDVDASNKTQQILVNSDGYFVHILRNDNLPIIPKHVIFILDVSGSMLGDKIAKMKDAMEKILLDLPISDCFSLILFSDNPVAWSPTIKTSLNGLKLTANNEPTNIKMHNDLVIPATKANIEEAIKFIKTVEPCEGTNILGALRNGLRLAKLGYDIHRNSINPPECMIIFLTDGMPNSEETNLGVIVHSIKYLNDYYKVPIFSLAFGYDADMDLLKRISLENYGFARRIYEDSDAALQLHNFYKEIDSPVLSDITFEYLPDMVESTTYNKFKHLFYGSDIAVLGKITIDGTVFGVLTAYSLGGLRTYNMTPADIILLPADDGDHKTNGYLEKMWAFKTIKYLLDQNLLARSSNIENELRKLSMKYSFVTPFNSLIVSIPEGPVYLDEIEASGPILYGEAFDSTIIHEGAVPSQLDDLSTGSFFTPYADETERNTKRHKDEEKQAYKDEPRDYEESLVEEPLDYEPYIKIDYFEVKWLNQTASENEEYIEVPSLLRTTDVIALNETDAVMSYCHNGNPCVHFIYCALSLFADEILDFIPLQCHIEPNYVGVCCPPAEFEAGL